ncbi:IclR family transcriptional regulator [Streptomyces sp. NPDC006856]|uniref:IclR family transcriptional regulator n=1 Tax=unclassified Streptomyces TaxID=2593676 RepID=UPI0036A64A3B
MLDKASTVLSVIENGPVSLAEVVERSGLARPTAHRIAVALERLGLLTRDFEGRFVLGPRLGSLSVEAQRDRLVQRALPVLTGLAADTGLDARLFRRRAGRRICIASSPAEPSRDPVPVGACHPLTSGPVAQVLLAWEEPEQLYEGLRGARFTAAQLAAVRQRCWAYGPDSAAGDTVSCAVPVQLRTGRVVAALAPVRDGGPDGRAAPSPARPLAGRRGRAGRRPGARACRIRSRGCHEALSEACDGSLLQGLLWPMN